MATTENTGRMREAARELVLRTLMTAGMTRAQAEYAATTDDAFYGRCDDLMSVFDDIVYDERDEARRDGDFDGYSRGWEQATAALEDR